MTSAPQISLPATGQWHVKMLRSENGLALESATDFILHLRYTARDGGPALERAARDALTPSRPSSQGVPR